VNRLIIVNPSTSFQRTVWPTHGSAVPYPLPPLGPTDWPTDRPNADEQTERPTGADRRGRGGTAGPVLTRVPTPVYRLVGMLMGPVFGAAAAHLIQYSLSFAAVLQNTFPNCIA